MEEKITGALVNKAMPVILAKMGSGFLQKSLEIIQALTPVLARKEAMVIKVAEAVAPFLGSATDRFIQYLQEANKLAIQTKDKEYEFITQVLCNDKMTFEQKIATVQKMKEESRKDKAQKHGIIKYIGNVALIAVGIVSAAVLGDKYIDLKKTETIEKGKADRSLIANLCKNRK